jgi:hypothetical protein
LRKFKLAHVRNLQLHEKKPGWNPAASQCKTVKQKIENELQTLNLYQITALTEPENKL